MATKSSAEPSLPPPGGFFEFQGVTVEVPHHWPDSWIASHTRVSTHLVDVIKTVLGGCTVHVRAPGHQGRYLKESRKAVGLSADGKRIMLEIMARVMKMKTDDAQAYQQVVQKSPWMNPNHPDWVRYLYHKVHVILISKPKPITSGSGPVRSDDIVEDDDKCIRRTGLSLPDAQPLTSDGVATGCCSPQSAPSSGSKRRGRPPKSSRGQDVVVPLLASMTPPEETAASLAAPASCAAASLASKRRGRLPNAKTTVADTVVDTVAADTGLSRDVACTVVAPARVDSDAETDTTGAEPALGSGRSSRSEVTAAVPPDPPAVSHQAPVAPPVNGASPSAVVMHVTRAANMCQQLTQRPVTHRNDVAVDEIVGDEDDEGPVLNAEGQRGDADNAAADDDDTSTAAGRRASNIADATCANAVSSPVAAAACAATAAGKQRLPLPSVPPPPQLPLPPAGQRYEFDGESIEVPSYWPADPKSHKTLVGRPLLLVINDVLGPNPANVRRTDLPGRYLRERGTRPGSGLADLGKETMLRILCQVQKLKSTNAPQYQQIMERHAWLTPDHPDCIAYLWSKVLLFINTWGPPKQVRQKKARPGAQTTTTFSALGNKVPRSLAFLFKRKASGAAIAFADVSGGAGGDSDSSNPASPAKRRLLSGAVESGCGSQPESPHQQHPDAASRRQAYAQAVVAAARRAQALMPPTYRFQQSSSSEAGSSDSESDNHDNGSSGSDTQVLVARTLSLKRSAASVVGLIPSSAMRMPAYGKGTRNSNHPNNNQSNTQEEQAVPAGLKKRCTTMPAVHMLQIRAADGGRVSFKPQEREDGIARETPLPLHGDVFCGLAARAQAPHGSWAGHSGDASLSQLHTPYAHPPYPARATRYDQPTHTSCVHQCPPLAQLLLLPPFAVAVEIAMQRARRLLEHMPRIECDVPGMELPPPHKHVPALSDYFQLYAPRDLRPWLFQVVRTFLLSCLMRCRPEDGTAACAAYLERMQARVHRLEGAVGAGAGGRTPGQLAEEMAVDAAVALLLQCVVDLAQAASADVAAAAGTSEERMVPRALPAILPWRFLSVLLTLRVQC